MIVLKYLYKKRLLKLKLTKFTKENINNWNYKLII
jgi:hypothetical protein